MNTQPLNLPWDKLQQLFRDYSLPDLLAATAAEKARRSSTLAREEKATAGVQPLREYARDAWAFLEPNTDLKWGWALDTICQHLEAVTFGRFLDMGLVNRLLINVPPGMMKSLLVGVIWPSWEWGPARMPWLSYLSAAYKDTLSARDTRKMRDLVESDWWQERWGRGTEADVYLIKRGETEFQNNHRGWRKALAFTSLTGDRADRVLVDDPHSTEQSESELERARAQRIFRESLHSRVNDPNRSAIIIIMQRLHAEDVSGLAIRSSQRYIHLMLPMEFEEWEGDGEKRVSRRCVTPLFTDPRQEGELLFPERFDAEWLEREKGTMTSYAVAGQFQQRPGKREGNMFKRHWFKVVGAVPAGTRWCRFFDLAATDEKFSQADTAETAGVLMGRHPSGGIYIADCVAERVENHEPLILNTATLDRPRYFPYEVGLPQDPGQAGKRQKKPLSLLLAEFNVRWLNEGSKGSKPQRAEPLASQAEIGNVHVVVERPHEPLPEWADTLIDELCAFPGGRKDKTDACSGAYHTLLKPPRLEDQNERPITGLSIYQR